MASRTVLASLPLLALVACSEHPFIDAAMRSAYRAPHSPALSAAITAGTPFQLLAGDLHAHVSPPDLSWHAVRGPAETLALAAAEGLDFVVLTPHVSARFFEDGAGRAEFLATHAALRNALARSARRDVIAIAGFEYTDHAYGHVGAAFADPAVVLGDVTVEASRARPERFFQAWVARGGTLVVNHPLVVPVASLVPIARADLSWRPWTRPAYLAPEIVALDALAHGFEAYNLTAAHVRDRVLFGDEDATFTATLARIDRAILAQRRRIAPVGGSDSHSHHLRATTFLLASERGERAIRDALVAGRVCVRSAEACSLRVRAPGGRWVPPGGAVRAGAGRLEVRASGMSIEVFANGRAVARPSSREVATIALDAEACTVVRARVGRGYSGAVYVNCEFAAPAREQDH